MYLAAAGEEIRQGRLSPIKLSNWNVAHEFNFVYTKNSIYEDEIRHVISMFKENN